MVTRLEFERRRRGWSQTELAFYAQMHQPDVSRFERQLQRPSPERRERLSRVLGVAPDELLDEVAVEAATEAATHVSK